MWKVSVVVGLPPFLFTMYVKKASRSLQLSMAFLMELIALTSLVGVRQFHALVRHSPNTQNCQHIVKFSQRYCPHLQLSKKFNTFAKSFLRCQSYESELSTMKSKRLEQILCLRKFYPYSHNFVCARLTKKKGCLLISGDRQLYM